MVGLVTLPRLRTSYLNPIPKKTSGNTEETVEHPFCVSHEKGAPGIFKAHSVLARQR